MKAIKRFEKEFLKILHGLPGCGAEIDLIEQVEFEKNGELLLGGMWVPWYGFGQDGEEKVEPVNVGPPQAQPHEIHRSQAACGSRTAFATRDSSGDPLPSGCGRAGKSATGLHNPKSRNALEGCLNPGADTLQMRQL